MEFLKGALGSLDLQALIYNSAPVVVGAIIAMFWAKIDKVMKAMKELADVIDVVNAALADKDLTQEEVKAIKKEIGEAIIAFKAIFKK